ncbi:MAG: DNA-binding protein WhiA [Spiroplasma poulsonii]|uniref:Probable cell division protein WhiA n=1 Tax=Spiroplasma poulsonii TaxID=2138 RepID=A0A2P6FB43_9MOLU|nr:DNA-binding protein WhiA [Spiroplasma poulsonii]KAF0851817.1 putative sporulation transcription regulator WhiA [Spiroplasma poulsonii]MBW1241378.1 DNA-binding protein WhiA [Spiroplasma poulsonii]PQM30604.1 putative sporulation transcription regulator WhiA [Spiroplasma poulsonii]PWF95583.1 Putative sporulation transcription regulator WhiA [Spiroplasma poulsonii]PWF98364.1 Putative sporulation transcription regulator WhiA [Spiroplasma poulsonii]
MSFALEVKEEIVKKEFDLICQKAFLCGFVKYNMTLNISNHYFNFEVSSISNAIIRTIYMFLKNLYHVEIDIIIMQTTKLKKHKTFILRIKERAAEILKDLNIFDADTNEKIITIPVDWSERQQRAYIAGIFVACGSVNSPETSNYHLEVQFIDEISAQTFRKLLHKFHFPFKIIMRHDKYVCYLKKSILVSDFLKLIDAINSVLVFENTRISRDMVNSINRLNNVEISNQQKAMKAGEEQAIMINYLLDHNLFDELNDNTRKIALLRVAYPDASLQDLSLLLESEHNLEISKSGVNHLFREIKKKYYENQK